MFMTPRERSLSLDACNFLLHQPPPYANSVEEIKAYILLFCQENDLVGAAPERIRQGMVSSRLKTIADELAQEKEKETFNNSMTAIGPYAAMNELLSIPEFKDFLDMLCKAYYRDPRVKAWCKGPAGAWQGIQPALHVLGRYMNENAERFWNEANEQGEKKGEQK